MRSAFRGVVLVAALSWAACGGNVVVDPEQETGGPGAGPGSGPGGGDDPASNCAQFCSVQQQYDCSGPTCESECLESYAVFPDACYPLLTPYLQCMVQQVGPQCDLPVACLALLLEVIDCLEL
ncbi:hypothetical protein [Chondromyces crocatus]|uniref:Secreted protein n=1 Tax=Chondromyces crocatus TaxID=52 RepID=A0A0K1EEH4_CHOCO|nr:hypothetical protein [Chondromyces crocatus]AKT39275.1 uncharacterized protein CMC5_034230 [Chondromyces crocatus]